MNAYALTVFAVSAFALLFLPRRWASVPLLVGAVYVTLGQGVMLAGGNFTITRLLLLVGLVRVLVRGEGLDGGMNRMDRWMWVWAACCVCSGFFHAPVGESLIFRLGMALNACGFYFLVRIFCRERADIVRFWTAAAVLLIPLASAMAWERRYGINVFAFMGGVPETPLLRGGQFRAQGPFLHAILAGTVGALCVPVLLGLWPRRRLLALLGLGACAVMIWASGSSGPLISAAAGLGAVWLWRHRAWVPRLRWGAVLVYLALELVMKAPPYYLLNRIDVISESTGFHRAALIDAALEHVGDWWFAGTDYTRHWLPTGVTYSADQVDITNYFIKLGVVGGLPLLAAFISLLVLAFRRVGAQAEDEEIPARDRYFVWCLGAMLLVAAASGLSVSFYDQSVLFVYGLLATVGSIPLSAQPAPVPEAASEPLSIPGDPHAPYPEEGMTHEHAT